MPIEVCLPPIPHVVLRGVDDVMALFGSTPEREWYAHQLAAAVAEHPHWTLPGYCSACQAPQLLHGTTPPGSTLASPLLPNYREMLQCPGCELINRQRLAAAVLIEAVEHRGGGKVIYLHEQITAMYRWAVGRFGPEHEVVGSEYLGPEHQPGAVIDGIRHEDALGLSFADESIDVILSTDVLEHVPDIKLALSEAARVLRPGGSLIFSIPFYYTEPETFRRAELLPDGSLVHHREPEYHGNPTLPEEGSLVFYDYGWDLLDFCRQAGFTDACGIGAWSIAHAVIGERFQPLFIAVKD